MRRLLIILLVGLASYSLGQDVKLGVPIGHSDIITSARFSSDNKLVLSSSLDKTIKLWEVNSGRLIRTIPFETNFRPGCIFSPDGSEIIACSADSIVFWSTLNGDLLKVVKLKNGGYIHSIQFGKNDNILIIKSQYKISAWDLKQEKEVNNYYSGYSKQIYSHSIHPDSSLVLISDSEENVRLYNYITDSVIKIADSDSLKLNDATFSPSGDIFTTITDNWIRVWSSNDLQVLHEFEAADQPDLFRTKISSDNESIATSAYDDSTILIFNLISGRSASIRHNDLVYDFEFTNEDNNLLTTSRDSTICLWDLNKGELKYRLRQNHGTAYKLILSKSGQQFLSIAHDKSISLWDTESGNLITKFSGYADVPTSIEFSPDEQFISNGAWNGNINIWNLKSGKIHKTLNGHSDLIARTSYSKDSRQLLSGSFDSTGILWNIEDGSTTIVLNHNGWVWSTAFESNSDLIATCSSDSTVKIIHSSTGKLKSHIKDDQPLVDIKFGADGKNIITVSENDAKLWSTSGKMRWRLKDKGYSPVTAVFSKKKNSVYLIGLEGVITELNISNGKVKDRFGYSSTLSSWDVGITSSRDEIITGSNDNSAQLWSLSEQKVIRQYIGHQNSIFSVDISPNDKIIATSSRDCSIILWDKQTGKQLIRLLYFEEDPNKWLHIHPSGLFDASPEAMELMYWTKGLEIIEFAQLKDRYWVPGLWEKVMKGEVLPDVRSMQELKLQPKVDLGEVVDGKLPITLTKRDGGYGKVAVFINGKEITSDARGDKVDEKKEKQTIYINIKEHPYLVNGNNTITVKASSADGFVQGRGEEIDAFFEATEPKDPQFFAVVVGVGDYINEKINLNYSVPDAKAIASSVEMGATNLFGEDRTFVYAITTEGEERPTKDNIYHIFEEIGSKAQAEDIILVYLSGHGVTWGGDQGDFYFLTADATSANKEAYSDPAIREKNTISTNEWVEWLKGIPALKQVMIIDACGSGKAVDNLLAARDVESSQIKAIDRMKDRTGMFIISGCAADAASYEASQYGQGLLTYSVLQAMKGAALRENKFIDVDLILNHARESVPELAKGVGGIQTPQLLIPKGGSFDIGYLNEGDKEKIPLAEAKKVFVRSAFFNTVEMEDNLELSILVNNELSAVSSRGGESKLVFFDAAKYPNACKITGGYTQENGLIKLDMKIRCGASVSEKKIEANSKEELVKQILDIANAIN